MHRAILFHVFAVVFFFAGCSSDPAAPAERSSSTAAPATVEGSTDPDPEPSTSTSPNAVSTTTMSTTAAIAPTTSTTTAAIAATACTTITDFDGGNEVWRTVNDGVMGGRSAGGPTFDDGEMTFLGELNTNGGGFSSVRAFLAPGTLAGADHIRVIGQPDQRSYRLILSDQAEGRNSRLSFQGDLVFSGDGEWQEASVRFDGLDTSVFGRSVSTDPFVPELAVEIGIQIADGIDGPFALIVDRIERCTSE